MGIFKLNGIDYMGGGGGGGSSTLAGLNDVDITTPSDGQLLIYDDANDEWVNGNIAGVNVQPLIYSTEERDVGVWTNGKPLYQKTYHLASTVVIDKNTWVSLGISGDGIDVITNKDVLDDQNRSTTVDYVAVRNGYINVLSVRGTDVQTITIWYTKTTDTPGSGTWAPQGVPAAHYSTNEQVVGTWIDGSTLYERTIDITGTVNMESVNTWVDTGVDISYVSGMIRAEVIAKDSMSIPALWVNKNASNHLTLLSSRANTFIGLYVTIRYTKTTS